jgi:hypothetical protein
MRHSIIPNATAPPTQPSTSVRSARAGSAASWFTGICHGSSMPAFADVATTAKKVPPMPVASAGTKLA